MLDEQVNPEQGGQASIQEGFLGEVNLVKSSTSDLIQGVPLSFQ